MILALKEITRNKARYGGIIAILVLLLFLVLFLSGLTNGLGAATGALIEDAPATYYVLNDDADKIITRSSLTTDQVDEVVASVGSDATPIAIKRSTMYIADSTTKVDITYFSTVPNIFMVPIPTEGSTITSSTTKHEVILDNSFQTKDISIGDTITDSNSELELTVVGFAPNLLYGHSSVGVVSDTTFAAMQTDTGNPNQTSTVNAVAITEDAPTLTIDGVSVLSKDDVLSNIPGRAQEQTTLNMMLYALLGVSAVILGVFIYVITLQKLSLYGTFKALGMTMKSISASLIAQVLMLSGVSVVIGNLLLFAMVLVLPKSMPFVLNLADIAMISLLFLAISVVSALISLRRIAKVDPIIVIGEM